MLKLMNIIAEFVDFVNNIKVREGFVGSTPCGDRKGERSARLDLRVDVFKKGEQGVFGGELDFFHLDAGR